MKVKLLRDARISHSVGEIVEVSPAERDFLISVGSAVDVAEKIEKAVLPQAEVAEKAVKAPAATTKKAPAKAPARKTTKK